MLYFNKEAYEALLRKTRAAGKDDPEIIRDATENCLRYVQTVCDGENCLISENMRRRIRKHKTEDRRQFRIRPGCGMISAVRLDSSDSADSDALLEYVLSLDGGAIGEEYADPYGQGRITGDH